MKIFDCPLDETVSVVIVDPSDYEYKKVNPIFQKKGHAFTLLNTDQRMIVIDGEVVSESWFEEEHLNVIMAHELGHLHMNTEDEVEADFYGLEQLHKHNLRDAFNLAFREIQHRYCPLT